MSDDDEQLDEEQQPQENDAADPRVVEQKQRRAKRELKESKEFWRKVFADPIGRREIWGILQAAHTFEERFACGPNGFPQAEATWFHAGEQALGQRLFQTLQARCFAGTHLMLIEHDPRFDPKTADMPDIDELTKGL